MITPNIMKNFKKIVPIIMAAALTCTSFPMAVKADSSKVVTLGANLTAEQKTSMYQYFGTTADKVDTIEVTNADERKYMEGIASEAQIGTRTYSCAYVEPTTSGGIQVKVGNLTFVTSSMIASTLMTSGVENCNVVAASPIEVSGTGALTGIMMAYEKASGTTLNEEQKAAATEELVTTGELADSIGQKEATDLMNEVKQEVIKEGLTDEDDIKEAIDDAAKTYNITLTEDQMSKINSLMQNISQYDYDVKALQKTLENLEGKASESGFFSNLWSSIKGVFTGGGDEESDGGIINNTNDDVLGTDAVIDSTLEALDSDTKDEGGFWDKVVGFFKDIFGGSDDADDEDAEEEDADEDADDESEESGDTEDTENDALDDETEDGSASDTVPTDNSADPAADETGADVTNQPDNSAADGSQTDGNPAADPAADGNAESDVVN